MPEQPKPIDPVHSGEGSDGRDPKTGRFAKGNPGRPPGLKDRRADRKEGLYQLLEYGAAADPRKGTKALPPRHERIRELLTSPDHNVRLATERFFWEQDFGRARQTIDMFVQSDVVKEARERVREYHERKRALLPAPTSASEPN